MQKVLPISRYAADMPLHRRIYSGVKRLFDIFASCILLLILLPLGLLLSVIAAVDTKGTPLFMQMRMGRGNRPFKLVKFRTMSVNAPSDVATYELEKAETYISSVGRTLRRLSLDELPQLWNILKGEMSFVGPRPVVLTETALLDLRTQNGASSIRPGLTGLAQISGRDDVTVPEKARLDGQYAHTMSLRVDLRILFKSVGYVLHARGVREGTNSAVADPLKKERSA